MVKCSELVSFLNHVLRVAEISDVSHNGLQVQGPEEIEKVGFAVDAAMATFEEAARRSMQLLVVHHGLFWKEVQLVAGAHYRRLKTLISEDIGLYAAHLPLDAQADIGNNRRIADILGLEDEGPFGDYHGELIGRLGRVRGGITREAMRSRISAALDTDCVMLPFGPERIERVGIVSGGGAELLRDALAEDCDAFITGEPEHSAYHVALEGGINVFMAGHYATETVGLKALQELVGKEFQVETEFIDFPTGL